MIKALGQIHPVLFYVFISQAFFCHAYCAGMLTISCIMRTAVCTSVTFLMTMLRLPFCSRKLHSRGFCAI